MEGGEEGVSQKSYRVQHLSRVVEASSLQTEPRGLKAMGDVKGAEESGWKDQQEADRVRYGQVGSSAGWRSQDCGKPCILAVYSLAQLATTIFITLMKLCLL